MKVGLVRRDTRGTGNVGVLKEGQRECQSPGDR